MKCFMLLCALAVVGVGARPSTMVTGAAENVEVGDTLNHDKNPLGKIETQDWTSQDTFKLAQSVLRTPLVDSVGDAISMLFTVFGNKRDVESSLDKIDLPVELQDVDWDAVLKHITGIAGDISSNAANILPSILGALGKRDLPVELQDVDWDAVLNHITGILGDISSNAANILPSILGSLGKRDVPVELQDVDWDAVLNHITGIAGDISSNAANILPSILGALGKREVGDDLGVQDFDFGDFLNIAKQFVPILNIIPDVGKRDLPVELRDVDLDAALGHIVGIIGQIDPNILTKILGPFAFLETLQGKRDLPVEIQDWTSQDTLQVAQAVLRSPLVNSVSGALGVLDSVFGIFSRKRDAETTSEIQDIEFVDNILDNFVGISTILPSLLGALGKREAVADLEVQDLSFDQWVNIFSPILGPLGKLGGAIFPGVGKREIGDDLEVQDLSFDEWVNIFSPILNIIPGVGKRDVETEDFDLEDITGALAKISKAWSDMVNTKLAPALAKLAKDGSLEKLVKLGQKYMNHESLTSP